MPFFSIIIATRNRPTEFGHALQSVLQQSWSDVEIIVVNDGSTGEHEVGYRSVLSEVDASRVRSLTLAPSDNGHGAGCARNFGAAEARAAYLCFLDDDDCWTDMDHLLRAQAVIAHAAGPVDLYMTNQAAFLHNAQKPGPVWIDDLPGILARQGNSPDRHGAYTVSLDDVLQSQGFCHLNTLIVRRALYEEIGGMEESIRWEEDRDLYLRLIDRAILMKYVAAVVARHNIPDPAKASSASTGMTELDRRLSQLVVFDRAFHHARHPLIRAHARRHKTYTLKRIAELLARTGRPREAASYARDALRTGPTVKWAAYTAWLNARALTAPFLSRA